MTTRFTNVRVLTLDNGNTDIFCGEVHVKDDTISYVGEKTDGSGSFDETIDGNGNLLMPGFKNAHAHAPMTFLRSFADDLPLYDWLHKQVFPKEALLTGEDIFWLTKLALLEYIDGGITSSFEMYAHPEQMAAASVEYGFRSVYVSPLNNFTSSVKQMEEEYEKLNQMNPLISYKLGFHAEYTTDESLLKETARLAHKYHAPVYSHNSETETEVKECTERHGMSPTAYFEKLGLFDFGGGIYHGVWLTDADMDIVKKHGVSVVTNPASNAKLASGIAPITRMLDKGIHLALGTDGPASNNCLDMFREMFLVTGLAKLREKDAAVCDAAEVLKMAVGGSAYAMGLDNCDCIKEGKKADLILIDLHQPNMQPLNNIVKNIVYSGNKKNISMTMVDGKILYRNGEYYLPDDPELVCENANSIIDRIKKTAN